MKLAADYDAVVIGAGPAGALAARGLAQAGCGVLLVDRQRFPRPKVCGCCLNRVALTNLDHVGLGGLAESLGAPTLDRLEMVAGGRRAAVALPRGVALSREALDTALIDAAVGAGAEFRSGVSAKVMPTDSSHTNQRAVTLGSDATVTARVIVVADGLGGTSLKNVPGFDVQSTVSSRIGFGGSTPEPSPCANAAVPSGTILMACGRIGYLGAVRLEDGRLDLAAAVDATAVKQAGGWAGVASRLIVESGLPEDVLPIGEVAQWRATPALTRRRSSIAAPGIFVVGDAAGYVEPFTGEGMAWAIAGGAAVVPIARRSVDGWNAAQEADWRSVYHRQVRRRQAGCRLVAATLRRPRVTRGVVRLLSAAPALARPIVGHITKPRPARDHNRIGSAPYTPLPPGTAA